MLALGVSSAAIYALAKNDVLDLNGQSQGILFILALGAATDYVALLLVSRFREELRDEESTYRAWARLPAAVRADPRVRRDGLSSVCSASCCRTCPAFVASALSGPSESPARCSRR